MILKAARRALKAISTLRECRCSHMKTYVCRQESEDLERSETFTNLPGGQGAAELSLVELTHARQQRPRLLRRSENGGRCGR